MYTTAIRAFTMLCTPSLQVKEVLSTTSRETWSEFVKVLELFSNDVVSKEDCLDLIGDLFGPNHNDLFHEFKRLLNSRYVYCCVPAVFSVYGYGGEVYRVTRAGVCDTS
jgi:hypothetical protein